MADLNKFLGGGGKHLKTYEQRDRVRDAGESELREVLEEVNGELLTLRTQALLQQTSNPMRTRQVKKLVARIHTELGARARKAAGA